MSNGNNNWLDVMFSEPNTALPPQVDNEQVDVDTQDTTATKEVDWLTTMFQQPQILPQQPIETDIKDGEKQKVETGITNYKFYSSAIKEAYDFDFDKDSQEKNTAVEDYFGKNFLTDFMGDMWRAWDQGTTQGSGLSEALALWRSNKVSDEEIQEFIDKQKELEAIGQTDEVIQNQKDYDAAIANGDNPVSAWLQAAVKNPSWLLQVGITSAANLARSLVDGPGITASVAAGAVATGQAGAALGTAVGGPIGTAIAGTISTAGGAIGTLSGIMETGLTMAEFINEELAGKEANIENIRAILSDEEKYSELTRRAVKRGVAIGFVDTITGGLAAQTGKALIKTATKRAVAGSMAAVDTAGGLTSELAGQLAGEQEINVQEILTEGFADKSNLAISGPAALLKAPKYSINKEPMSGKKFREVINTMSDEDLAGVSYEIKNDDNFKAIIDNRVQDLTIDSDKVDSKVTDQQDRTKLINLHRAEMLIGEARTDLQKKKLKKIQDEISEINDKYVDSEVDVNLETRRNAIKTARENRLMQNAEEVAKDLGFSKGPELVQTDKEYKDKVASDYYDMSYDQLKVLNPKAAEALDRNNGVFLGKGKMFINKEVALQTNAVGVAAHEILHPVLNALVGDGAKQGVIVDQFKELMTSKQLRYVQNQLNRNYTVRDQNGSIDVEKTRALQNSEFITVFSQGIIENKINYDKTVFEKIKEFLTNMFKDQGFENIDFVSGQGVFNFIKDYNKSFEKGGKLSEKSKVAVKTREAKTKVKVAQVGLLDDDVMQASRADLLKSIDDIVPSEVTKEDFTLVESGKLNDKGKPIMQMTSTMSDISAKIEGNLLDGLIMRGIATNRDGNLAGLKVSEQEFKTRVKRVIGKRLKNFDPAKNDSFAGWLTGMNGALNFARQDVFKEISDEIATVSLDAPATDTGTTFASQLEDQGQVQETDFETEDLSIKPKAKSTETTQEEMSSGETLRERLGIEKFDDIYNSILDKVRSVFEGKPISVKGPDEVKFRKDLDKEFKETLFKVIKNLIGPDHAKNVVPFLNKNFDILYDSFSVRTLIDLERESKTEQGERSRKFAKRKKYLTEEEKNKTIGTYISRDDFNAANDNDYIKLNVSKKDFIGFFDIDLYQVSKKTGIKGRSGLRGTRKDSLARGISRELSFDATMQALADPDFIEQRIARNGITKEMFDVKLRELSHIISRGDDQRAIYQDKTRVFGGQFSVADATPDVAETINKKPNEVLQRINDFLSKATKSDKNDYELSKEQLDDTDPISKAAVYLVQQYKELLVDYVPVTEFEARDRIEFIQLVADTGLIDNLDAVTNKNGERIVDMSELDAKTIAGAIKLLSKTRKQTNKKTGETKEVPSKVNEEKNNKKGKVVPKNVEKYQKEAKALIDSLPAGMISLLNAVSSPSRWAQFAGQHYRLLEASNKYSSFNLNSYQSFQLTENKKQRGISEENVNKRINELEKINNKTDIEKVELDFLRQYKEAVDLAKIPNNRNNRLSYLQPLITRSRVGTIVHRIKTSKTNRKTLIDQAQDTIDRVNMANEAMFKALVLSKRLAYLKEDASKEYLFSIMAGQSNLLSGLRAFSRIEGFSETGKIEYGQHININAQTMFEAFRYIVSGEGNLNDISGKHSQYFMSTDEATIMDRETGKTNTKDSGLKKAKDAGITIIETVPLEEQLKRAIEAFNGERIQQSKSVIQKDQKITSLPAFSKANFPKLVNYRPYKKFLKVLKGVTLYHGGTATINGLKKSDNKNHATWWYAGDSTAANIWAGASAVKDMENAGIDIDINPETGVPFKTGPYKKIDIKTYNEKFNPRDQLYKVEFNNLKDVLVLPDIEDTSTFKKFFDEKFPEIVEEFNVNVGSFRGVGEQVGIFDLPAKDAEFILMEYMTFAEKNGFDYDLGIPDIYDIENYAPAVTVIGKIQSNSIQRTYPKDFEFISDIYEEFDQFINEEPKTRLQYLKLNKKTGNALAEPASLQFSKPDIEKAKESPLIGKVFNQIIEQNKGIKEDETFSETVARQRGATIGRYQFFVPPSANDFMGLLYSFLGKRKLGDAQKKFFEDYLNAPYKRGIAQMESAKQKIEDDYRKLRQKFKPIAKKLGKKIPELNGTKLEGFTYDQAVRIYLWDYSTSFENVAEKTGLDERDVKTLAKIVQDDTQLTQFARGLGLITGLQEGYVAITDTWLTDNIAADLNNIVDKINRKQFLDEFVQNKNEIFSKENLNKIEAIYGYNFREALEDILYRMENGTNRNFGKNRLVNTFSNWINNSVGAIMFFNMRSAFLQTISAVNFLNWSDNNPLMAAKAFANQPQFWSDFAMIFNSDKLEQRRKGLKIDVNQAELANSVADSKNKAKAALRYLLKIGFAPTQIADSFAIAVGGASMYRNRVNTKLKEGKSKEVAEREAFEEFSAIAEETQQSADPALISQQQSGPLGRLILAFANTPMQYARLIKKAAQDLAARRGDTKTHISKIIYYLAVQNIIFTSMQTALFAMMFDDDEEDEELKAEISKKEFSVANNMIDTLLRGAGLAGAAAATVKNAILQYHKESNKEYGEDHAYVLLQLANISPPIGSKLRKVYRAIQTSEFDKDIIDERGFAIDSPIYKVGGDLISATTNVPADRLVNKLNNVISAFDEDNKTWQRIALALGWSAWELNVKNEEHELIKTNANDARRKEGYKKSAKKRKERQSLDQRLKTDRKSLQKRLKN